MTVSTAPDAFLRELGDMHDFIADLLDCPIGPGWHWPSFYLLYVDADRLAMLLARLHLVLDPPIAATAPVPPADLADDMRRLLERVARCQKSLVGSLWPMYRAGAPAAARRARYGRIEAHLHPKSGWYQTFARQYGDVEVADHGLVLSRTVLTIDEGAGREPIDWHCAACMLQRQSFDIGTPQARLLLASAVGAAEERLGSILALMGKHLLAHCRIENLLHPCSH